MKGLVDTSVFIAREAGRPLESLPDEPAVSVVTLAELHLGVLRARDAQTRARPRRRSPAARDGSLDRGNRRPARTRGLHPGCRFRWHPTSQGSEGLKNL